MFTVDRGKRFEGQLWVGTSSQRHANFGYFLWRRSVNNDSDTDTFVEQEALLYTQYRN